MLLAAGTLAIGVIMAWWPAEVHASAAPLLAAAALVLLPVGWRRRGDLPAGWPLALLPAAWWACGLLLGWDRAAALEQAALLAAIAGAAWLAARERPPEIAPLLLAVGLASLAVWAVWQVASGFRMVEQQLTTLPVGLRELARQRLVTGRAFASQPLPGDLAVLLATALPLLVSGLRRRPRWPYAAATGLATIGIVLTRSVLGVALAVVAVLAVVRPTGDRRLIRIAAVVVLLLAVVGTVLALRGDLANLEPLRLRLDNWHSALWVWSGSPLLGVGPGGFAQASQAVPFPVGNRPAHAHCLPLEWLAELGPVGLALAAALYLWLGRLCRRVWLQRPELAVAVAVVPLHNLVDFSWYLSGVALPWAVLLGWAVATARAAPLPERPPQGRAVAVVLVTAALGVCLLHASSAVVEEAAAASGEPAQQCHLALRAAELAPWRLPPIFLAGTAALADGAPDELGAARRVVRAARWLRPHSAARLELETRLTLAGGDRVGGLVAAWGAHVEQPGSATAAAVVRQLLRPPGAQAR